MFFFYCCLYLCCRWRSKYQEEEERHLINRFNPAILLCRSQDRTWISNVMCSIIWGLKLVVCLLFYIDGIVEDSTKSQICLSIICTLSASLTTLLLLKWSFIGIKGINCVSFYDSSIGFWKCSDSVTYLFFTLFLCTIFYKINTQLTQPAIQSLKQLCQ